MINSVFTSSMPHFPSSRPHTSALPRYFLNRPIPCYCRLIPRSKLVGSTLCNQLFHQFWKRYYFSLCLLVLSSARTDLNTFSNQFYPARFRCCFGCLSEQTCFILCGICIQSASLTTRAQFQLSCIAIWEWANNSLFLVVTENFQLCTSS